MNAAAPTTSPEAEAEDPTPGSEQLLLIYESLGLRRDDATIAAAADLACGWYSAE